MHKGVGEGLGPHLSKVETGGAVRTVVSAYVDSPFLLPFPAKGAMQIASGVAVLCLPVEFTK